MPITPWNVVPFVFCYGRLSIVVHQVLTELSWSVHLRLGAIVNFGKRRCEALIIAHYRRAPIVARYLRHWRGRSKPKRRESPQTATSVPASFKKQATHFILVSSF